MDAGIRALLSLNALGSCLRIALIVSTDESPLKARSPVSSS